MDEIFARSAGPEHVVYSADRREGPLHAPVSGQTNCRIVAIQGSLGIQLQLLRCSHANVNLLTKRMA